jgi:hypothetical protein
MTIAEIRGKISPQRENLSERMEDLLTSDVFGSFRYLPPDRGLLQFLATARTADNELFMPGVEAHNVQWSFWPRLYRKGYSSCEPDVVIGLTDSQNKTHLIMVEAKYFSGKSSFEEEGEEDIGYQLARELDILNVVTPEDLDWDHPKEIIARTLLYVTKDVAFPHSSISESLREYYKKRKSPGLIYWTSWRRLSSLVFHKLLYNERACQEWLWRRLSTPTV